MSWISCWGQKVRLCQPDVKIGRYFPAPFPNESLFSVLQRLVLVHGPSHPKATVKKLFDSSSLQLCSPFPSVIPAVVNLSGIEANNWIDKHTILPMFRLFTSNTDFDVAKNDLINGRGEHVFKALSLIANRQCATGYMHYCSVCAKEDGDKVGLGYWHIEHQLPGVYVCALHSLRLISVRVSRKRFDYWPGVKTNDIPKVHKRYLELSQFTHQLYVQATEINLQSSLADNYIIALKEKGFVTKGGSIRHSQLRVALISYWKPLMEHAEIGELFSSKRQPLYPACLFYNRNATHAPLKHLLLLSYLFDSVDEFLLYDKSVSFVACDSDEVVSEKPTDVTATIVKMLGRGMSLRQVAMKTASSVTYIKKVAAVNRFKIDSRAQRIFKTEKRSIAIKLLAGYRTDILAKQFTVSQGAIEQILSQHPDIVLLRKLRRVYDKRKQMRASLILTLNKPLLLTRNEIKKANNAAYAWLYKHDRVWLYTILPPSIPRTERYLGR